MKAFIFVLMTIVLSACATANRHPIEEGGSLGGFKGQNSGPDRYQAGYFDTGSTRN